MSSPSVTASYRNVSSEAHEGASTTATAPSASTSGPLSFEAPIDLSSQEPSSASPQAAKEQYLAALAKALSSLQSSINTGLTERLVQQGVLSESTDQDPNVNTKLRTKVPGQPNNSKKAQAKKQRQQQQKQGQQEESSTAEAGAAETTESSTAAEGEAKTTDTSMDATPSEGQTVQDTDMEELYRPKGGIYGGDDEDEDNKDKDEVDMVMEADPGEVDGACLELPKEQETLNKKRNEQPTDTTTLDAATKKSRGVQNMVRDRVERWRIFGM
ncbi:hypothetical protein BGX31_005601 [Mortierella sp. GBA43]|nr:hypothetical protein BGX31_005601 [Mortierella sp. GBA43]